MNIPLIIPNFNQLSYLRNILNWWSFYYPNNDIWIVDNHSTYEPLLEFYERAKREYGVGVLFYPENTFIPNLRHAIDGAVKGHYEYYCISDADIMPHPSTPPNFLDVWKHYIDIKGYHRVGFNLITDGLPQWLNERANIIYNESQLLVNQTEEYEGWKGYKAPVDTTFALYTTHNSGWNAPMDGKDWGNCLRIFDAFHLGWHQHPEIINPEMEYYFTHAKYRVPGEPSAGANNNRPQKFMPK